MKNLQPLFIALFISFTLLFNVSPQQLCAQSIVGKWQIEGHDNKLHFSPEGIFRLQSAESDYWGIFNCMDGLLAVVPLASPEKALLYEVDQKSARRVVLTEADSGNELILKYVSSAEIPYEVKAELAPVLAELDIDNSEEVDNTASNSTYDNSTNADNSASIYGYWTWTGTNGSGTSKLFSDGYWIASFQNGTKNYAKFTQNGNKITQKFIGGSTHEYEIRNRRNNSFTLVSLSSGDSWVYTYQGEASITTNEQLALQNMLTNEFNITNQAMMAIGTAMGDANLIYGN